MAVYTTVSRSELVELLSHYPLGELRAQRPIAGGITNTNYFVDTGCGRYVLTLLEDESADDAGYFFALTAHLQEHGVPCAHPVADVDGHYLRTLHGKPAALVERLGGKQLCRPTPAQCAAAGEQLARLHLAGQDFAQRRNNPRGRHWWRIARARLRPVLPADELTLLETELQALRVLDWSALPCGVIHGDYFIDNLLFEGDGVAGVLDFYYACDEAMLFDLAIAVNDWCSDDGGALDPDRSDAMLRVYAVIRPFSDAEREAWPLMARAAALRFWLSRQLDRYFPRVGELPGSKSPDEFARILQARQREAGSLSLP